MRIRTGGFEPHMTDPRVPTPIDADVIFYFDPVCPFAWITSRWFEKVRAQRGYTVDYRFISLRQLNAHIDYDTHFPPEYEEGHNAGLRMLRLAAAVRDAAGRAAMGDLYAALSTTVFDVPRGGDDVAEAGRRAALGTPDHVAPILQALGHDPALADALYDESWDAIVQAETDEALARTGKDVGTPIISFQPPDGPSFFGPVISRIPSDEEAVELWDAAVTLARFPGFAEMKRSLRERPQLRSFGVEPGETGAEEDWHGGSRRQKK